jgi:molybdopterin-guanine dinucleotide biosynthesis protein A
MGNVDKGLQLLQGRALIGWVLQRIVPQVGEVLINANRNLQVYAALGHRVVEDRIAGFAGPLAGIQSALVQAQHDMMIAVPCDTPYLPENLVARLAAPLLADERLELSVARTGTQPHPVICLMRKRVLPHLSAYLEGGGRKVDAWYATLKAAEVAFDDCPQAFRNINTAEELQAIDRAQGS